MIPCDSMHGNGMKLSYGTIVRHEFGSGYGLFWNPRLFCIICIFLIILYKASLGYKNHKSCKILPKFSSALHFLQESYKFVQESQILQICYNVEHFLQDSDNIFAKNAFFW